MAALCELSESAIPSSPLAADAAGWWDGSVTGSGKGDAVLSAAALAPSRAASRSAVATAGAALGAAEAAAAASCCAPAVMRRRPHVLSLQRCNHISDDFIGLGVCRSCCSGGYDSHRRVSTVSPLDRGCCSPVHILCSAAGVGTASPQLTAMPSRKCGWRLCHLRGLPGSRISGVSAPRPPRPPPVPWNLSCSCTTPPASCIHRQILTSRHAPAPSLNLSCAAQRNTMSSVWHIQRYSRRSLVTASPDHLDCEQRLRCDTALRNRAWDLVEPRHVQVRHPAWRRTRQLVAPPWSGSACGVHSSDVSCHDRNMHLRTARSCLHVKSAAHCMQPSRTPWSMHSIRAQRRCTGC